MSANVYQRASETRDEGSGGAAQDMQAGAIGTDVHATKMARAGADGYAQPTTERPKEPHRFRKPRQQGVRGRSSLLLVAIRRGSVSR